MSRVLWVACRVTLSASALGLLLSAAGAPAEPVARVTTPMGQLVTVEGETRGFQVSAEARPGEPGVEIVTLRLTAPQPAAPPPLTLRFRQPGADVQSVWHPGAHVDKVALYGWHRLYDPAAVTASAGPGLFSSATFQAPVFSLVGGRDENRLTFALSDLVNGAFLNAAVDERSADFDCTAVLFSVPVQPARERVLELRLDTRHLPLVDALASVQEWWQITGGLRPAPVPDAARLPLYSSWYAFHQDVNAAELESELQEARRLGCRAVITDDGWQTDLSEGNVFYGDWLPALNKFPDFKGHVARAHDLGLKYMAWIALPLVGEKSRAFQQFKDKTLYFIPWAKSWVLDPRFPEVRQHLAGTCERLVRDYDLDGLKLDYVDRLNSREGRPLATGGGRDTDSVEEGADRLLVEITKRLRNAKSDALIELRQMYTGPVMRQYGNMLRAHDCAFAGAENRVRTLDLRLLAGRTAVHSDMLVWNANEPAQVAALQLENVLFAVPQISVRPTRLPPEQRAMLDFLLKFWTEQRDVLLDGALTPENPELNYPAVTARSDRKQITALYALGAVAEIEDRPYVAVVNARRSGEVLLNVPEAIGRRQVSVFDCTGQRTRRQLLAFDAGAHVLPVPPAGILILEK